jgi:hypothetical protein
MNENNIKIKPDFNITLMRKQEKQYINMQDYIGANQIKQKTDKLEIQDMNIKN